MGRFTGELGATASLMRTSSTRCPIRSPGLSWGMILRATCLPDPTALGTCSSWSSWSSEETSW